MPHFGDAHKLLSPRHKDTSPPAAGADPDDGQLATWSAALGAWIAADPLPSITDHGLLSGLYPDDDHAQYALANKSRPNPWVAPGDLAALSIASFLHKGHDLLDGLLDDDHTQYARLLGRATGQTLYGGTAYGQQLGLISRLGAPSGILSLQEASPQLALSGSFDASGHIAAGGSASVDTSRIISVLATLDTQQAIAFYGVVIGSRGSGASLAMGLAGGASVQGTPFIGYAYGLYFYAGHDTESPCYSTIPIYIMQQSGAAGTGALSFGTGIQIAGAGWSGSKPGESKGISIGDQGGAGVVTAYGVDMVDQTGATVRLLELGPPTPYLRLGGGANPAANVSHLSLKFGATLKVLSEYDADSAGVGYRAVRVPN